ncbi:hypothetical protein BHM03_00038336 [Ensete ventricosum]|nr:hypothetical protein BHM03_00038336 [Ensete ventricosum]
MSKRRMSARRRVQERHVRHSGEDAKAWGRIFVVLLDRGPPLWLPRRVSRTRLTAVAPVGDSVWFTTIPTEREREREFDMGASTFGLHACLLRSLGCKQLSNLTFAAPVYTQRKSISSMQCMRDHEVIAVRGARGS